MKKIATLVFFVFLVAMMMALKGMAQSSVIVVKAGARPKVVGSSPDGYWRWNRHIKQYVWVWYRPAHHRRVVRVRHY